MDAGASYLITRTRLLELAESLTEGAAAEPVPWLPGWTVKDAYAHLSGLGADVVDGRRVGAGTPEWTARQVDTRQDWSLGQVCDEWSERGPLVDEWIRENGDAASLFIALDAWNHEQDIRATVGLQGTRGDERVAYLAARARVAFDGRFREASAPALRLVCGEDETVLGDGSPEATLRIDDYELLRMLSARRSHDQIVRADWTGDPAPYVEHLHLFPLPVDDLTD